MTHNNFILMRYLSLILLFFTLIILFFCNDVDVQEPDETLINCDKLTSREEANNLIDQLNANHLKDSSTIMTSLIGEWGLIGVVSGWMGFETGQECLKMRITKDLIELEDIHSGESSTSDWELKIFEVNGFTGFYLETNEDTWNNRMGMEIFSENIMLGSGRVDDGDIYIYEKLER